MGLDKSKATTEIKPVLVNTFLIYKGFIRNVLVGTWDKLKNLMVPFI